MDTTMSNQPMTTASPSTVASMRNSMRTQGVCDGYRLVDSADFKIAKEIRGEDAARNLVRVMTMTRAWEAVDEYIRFCGVGTADRWHLYDNYCAGLFDAVLAVTGMQF